eukprot:5198467-Amphidinium_carterae.1
MSGPAKHIQDALEVEPDQCICELALYTSWKALFTCFKSQSIAARAYANAVQKFSNKYTPNI